MKKVYEAPFAEKVEFNYSEVVAQSDKPIGTHYKANLGDCRCGHNDSLGSEVG